MKTILINQPGEIKVTDTPMPEVKPGEALLRIRYCGICGADVASYTGNQPFTTYPRIPGHEFSAEIVEIPENKYGLAVTTSPTFKPYLFSGISTISALNSCPGILGYVVKGWFPV